VDITKSKKLFSRAKEVIPGGVNSPVRAFKSVGGVPRFLSRGRGAYIWDADDNRYIDYMMSWGPLILGHAHPKVVEAVREAASAGTSFGASTAGEIELAEMVIDRFLAVEMLRLVSSGTEAAMTAIRLARAVTGRELVVKFDGCYHGHSNGLLVKAGSGLATQGLPGSAGVPESAARGTISLPYNDLEAVWKTFDKRGEDIAGIIVEPAAANMGVVPPVEGFLNGLRMAAEKDGAVLIFDEVISGFRVARGGACELYNIRPDLVCFGKILGGGMPIGAVGGKREIMERLAPAGNVYQAGTLSGNPVSVAAGIATLRELETPGFYERLNNTTKKLALGLEEILTEAEIRVVINRLTGLLTVFFGEGEISDYQLVQNCDMDRYARFFRGMLDEGVYLPPSGYEAWFLSSAHNDDEIERTLKAAGNVVEELTTNEYE